MSKYTPVKNYSDRTPNNRLIDAEDIGILISVAEAKDFPNREQMKIEKLQAEIAKEQAKKYPCSDYIARCEVKIVEIKQSITFYNLQRSRS